MKKLFKMGLLAVFFVMASCTTDANDEGDDWDAAKVCPETGTNAYGMPNRGEFTDARDGRVYKYTTIGDQVWMAENLKYEAENSECKEVFDGFCEIFGRYYSLAAGGKSTGALDPEIVSKMCPSGWHVPTKEEWEILVENMGGGDNETAFRIKSSDFWGISGENGSDTCSFNALPAGRFGDNGSYDALFYSSFFLVNSSYSENLYGNYVVLSNVAYNKNSDRGSIRCLRDN
ncbi:MAG: hypothetical protein MJY99_12820 [Fibrobacter sp.]|nr:hypothetical protein [Fibrobacter sp.]